MLLLLLLLIPSISFAQPYVHDFTDTTGWHHPNQVIYAFCGDASGENPQLCGTTETDQRGMFLIHIYGDDPNTVYKEGPYNNEPIMFASEQLKDFTPFRSDTVYRFHKVTGFENTYVFFRYPGDINRDNKIDIIDAIKIIHVAVGLLPLPDNIELYDLNGDCTIDIIDMTLISDMAFRGGNNSIGKITYACQ